jgi:hypothetical protein
MFEREMALFARLGGGDPADPRRALRREIDAFAWDLVSRLTGTVAEDNAPTREIPLDRNAARG